MVIYVKGLLTIKLLEPLAGPLARSNDKLKPLCLQYYSTYFHQTWHPDELNQWAATHKFL